MRIIQTGIPNIVTDNIDKSKLDLADKVIELAFPLLNKEYQDKVNEITILRKQFSAVKKKIDSRKELLEELMLKYNKQKAIKRVLDEVSNLIGSKSIIFEGSLKNEIIVLLKVIDTLNEERLSRQLQELKVLNTKRKV